MPNENLEEKLTLVQQIELKCLRACTKEITSPLTVDKYIDQINELLKESSLPKKIFWREVADTIRQIGYTSSERAIKVYSTFREQLVECEKYDN